MSSYRNHIKKMTKILLDSSSKDLKVVDVEKVKIPKVVKPKNKNNHLLELSEVEKQNITDAVDFYEFIDNDSVDDSEE